MRNSEVLHKSQSFETPRQPPATRGLYTCYKLLKCIYFTSYDLFKLENTGPHVSVIIFIIGLSLESVEEWLLVCCVGEKIGVFISSNI